MPFFKVVTVTKIEREVVVEAENMSFAMTKAFDAIRKATNNNPIPYTGLFFEEAHAHKLPDTITVEEILRMEARSQLIR